MTHGLARQVNMFAAPTVCHHAYKLLSCWLFMLLLV